MAFSSIREMTGFDIHTIDLRIPPSSPTKKALQEQVSWAQLFKGRLLLTRGKILIQAPVSFVQKHFFLFILTFQFRASKHQI